MEVQTSKGPQETATLGRTAAAEGLLTISMHWPLHRAAIGAVTPDQDLRTEAAPTQPALALYLQTLRGLALDPLQPEEGR